MNILIFEYTHIQTSLYFLTLISNIYCIVIFYICSFFNSVGWTWHFARSTRPIAQWPSRPLIPLGPCPVGGETSAGKLFQTHLHLAILKLHLFEKHIKLLHI